MFRENLQRQIMMFCRMFFSGHVPRHKRSAHFPYVSGDRPADPGGNRKMPIGTGHIDDIPADPEKGSDAVRTPGK